MKEVVLNDGDKIYFDWADSKAPSRGQSFGRAEFVICLVWKYGKLKRALIYRKQQREKRDEFYSVELGHQKEITIQSWTGLDDPKQWKYFYCKEHKCMSIELYVPNNSEWLQISKLSTFSIYFGKG